MPFQFCGCFACLLMIIQNYWHLLKLIVRGVFNGKTPFNIMVVITIPRIVFLTESYVSCLLLDLKSKEVNSVFWLMQNKEVVNAGECFCNRNGLSIKV